MGQGTGGAWPLHPQLAADCHVLGHCDGNRLLLQRNAALPWFVLVPPTEATELHDLAPPLRARLEAASDRLARFTKRHFRCDKMNIAAIGNLVPQLHLHVIGRRRDDPCWPRPVWGHLAAGGDYAPASLSHLAQALRDAGCLD
jgi:diadenosine tetraphosphate (Ap4A) HIT family hydrolase